MSSLLLLEGPEEERTPTKLCFLQKKNGFRVCVSRDAGPFIELQFPAFIPMKFIAENHAS